ncbi:uncharacterized protein LOC144753633 [Lissotriton helveticus]
MYTFGRPIPEEEQPFAAPRRPEPYSQWYALPRKGKIVVIVVFIIIFLIILGILFFLDEAYPVYKLVPTPSPLPEHNMITVDYGEHGMRKGYRDNVFIKTLHHAHAVYNVTDCWVWGLLPSAAYKKDRLLALQLTPVNSCVGWYTLIGMVKFFQQPDSLTPRLPDTRSTLTMRVRSLPPSSLGRLFTDGRFDQTFLETCCKKVERFGMPNDTDKVRESFLQLNSSLSYRHPPAANSSGHSLVPLATVGPSPYFCIQGRGPIKVGDSLCNVTASIRLPLSPSMVTPPNIYFVCGNNGYLWLPEGWGGTCYLAYLLPPVYVAPSDYHKTHRRFAIMQGLRKRRDLQVEDVDRTDTSGQQFTDFSKGLLPFWGPIFNSRAIRRLSRVMEKVVTTEADIAANMSLEMQAMRLFTIQNRMVLDVILADRGGACRVIGTSCCVYIPDSAPTVNLAVQKLHRLAAELHQDTGTWSLQTWLWGIFSS